MAERGAAVDAGTHRLVYSYRPRAFRTGCVVSLVGPTDPVVLGVIGVARPVSAIAAGIDPAARRSSVGAGDEGLRDTHGSG